LLTKRVSPLRRLVFLVRVFLCRYFIQLYRPLDKWYLLKRNIM
jgi:hypothetical protein